MKFEVVKVQIADFKKNVRAYKKLLFSSAHFGEIVTNHDEIEEKRSNLVKTYAKLELYIQIIGKNPRMHDGVWAHLYSVYDNGLSSDILSRVGPSIEGILTDLDYIEGKLESITENEFDEIVKKKEKKVTVKKELKNKQKDGNYQNNGNNYWNVVNPFWLLFKLSMIIWKYKIVSLCVFVIGLFAVDYALAWKNANWFWNFIMGIIK